jgi:small-conductance mechanosensitive channel
VKQKAALSDSLLGGLWSDLQNPGLLTHAVAVILSVGVAWVLAKWLENRWQTQQSGRVLVSGGLWRRGGFPLLAALILQLSDWLVSDLVQANLLPLFKTLFFAMAVIRVTVYAAHRALSNVTLPKGTDQWISGLVWSVVALHLLGWLDDLELFLSSITLPLGKTNLSLLTVLNGVFTTTVTLLASLWLGAALETRLMQVQSIDMSFRAVIGRVMRAALIVLAVLLSMSLAGIDLTILSVFGGALGVGLGLGMQRIASNYVSGFIILLDRSVRMGQPISVDKYSGVVSEIKTRYTVLRNPDGMQSVVPNEMLVSLPVTSNPVSTRKNKEIIRLSLTGSTNIQRVLDRLVEVAMAHVRVESAPGARAHVVDVGQGLFVVELAYWLTQDESDAAGIRSDLLIAIASALQSTSVHFASVAAKP